jgi:CheY-like chemotaxis protein
MPIVDGFSSTKMIRSFEKTKSVACLSPRAVCNGRIPIFAVSASLIEREREKYIESGFDGWILKPVDFKRVNLLLKGIVDEEIRAACVYEPGKWEQGGWLSSKQDQKNMYEAVTTPSEAKPTAEAEREIEDGRSGDLPASEGSITPTPSINRRDTT